MWVLWALVDLWCGIDVGYVVFFFVLCGFDLDCDVLVMFLIRCIVYCRVPGLHCAGGLIGTWLVVQSTVSSLL